LSRYAARLKNAGLDSITVSVDAADKNIYKSIRKGGKLIHVISGLRASKLAGLPIRINTVLMRSNADQVEGLMQLAIETGASLKFIDLMDVNNNPEFWRKEFYPFADHITNLSKGSKGKLNSDIKKVFSLSRIEDVHSLTALASQSNKLVLKKALTRHDCFFMDECRWSDKECPAVKLTRAIVDKDNKIKPCFHGEVIAKVDAKEVEILVGEILKADKVFLIAVGRVFLSLQCFGKRLSHLGIEVHVVGSIAEKPITGRDLLIVASGSGESVVPLVIVQKAKKYNAKIGIITSSRSSTIKSLADFAVHLPCPTKTDKEQGVKSIQPMSTLFDQSLHVFGDAVSMVIQMRKNLPKEELWKYHANLE